MNAWHFGQPKTSLKLLKKIKKKKKTHFGVNGLPFFVSVVSFEKTENGGAKNVGKSRPFSA